jgi:hypothetical protein
MTRFIAIEFVAAPLVECPIRVVNGSGAEAGRSLRGNGRFPGRSPRAVRRIGRWPARYTVGRNVSLDPGR